MPWYKYWILSPPPVDSIFAAAYPKQYAHMLYATPDVLLYAGLGVWVVRDRFSDTHPAN